jgi:hypothetical protein
MDLLEDWGQPRPILVALAAEESDAALSFRNLARVAVLTHEDVGVADLVGAASLVLSQAALDALTARAGGESGSGSPAAAKASESKGAAKAAPAKAKATAGAPESPAEAAQDIPESPAETAQDTPESPAEAAQDTPDGGEE